MGRERGVNNVKGFVDAAFHTAFIGSIFAVILLIVASLGLALHDRYQSEQRRKTVSVMKCSVWNPDQAIDTIQIQDNNLRITEFGIVIGEHGLYVPTTNELCIKADR